MSAVDPGPGVLHVVPDPDFVHRGLPYEFVRVIQPSFDLVRVRGPE